MSKLNQYFAITNPKRIFRADDKDDVLLFKNFMETNRWGFPCPFFLEEPYLTIPDMIKDKFIKHMLKINND